MLGIGLALAVAPRVARGYVSPDTAGFIVGLLVELVTGALLGFLVLIVFSAVQSAGNLVDLFGGFQLAQGFDPQMMINGAQFARLYQMTALALLFASGGYQLIVGGLARSFTALPVAGVLDLAAPMHAITLAVGQMLLSAVQIAGPLIVVLFLADAGLGLLTRVAPALNAFALGFPLKIFITLALGVVVFAALPQIVQAITGQAVSLFSGVK
jgi:flagellar biosynthetic protein FliR